MPVALLVLADTDIEFTVEMSTRAGFNVLKPAPDLLGYWWAILGLNQ